MTSTHKRETLHSAGPYGLLNKWELTILKCLLRNNRFGYGMVLVLVIHTALVI